jgi:hypothetical protein
MKTFFTCIALLCLGGAHGASAQTLASGQLTMLYKLEQMQQDAYLVQRGWKFAGTNEQGDSIRSVYWRYYNSTGRLVSEVGVKNKVGEYSALSYSTLLRPAYDAIRRAVLAVPMEVLGTDNKGAMRTLYRDDKFDVILVVSSADDDLGYHFTLQQHGLTKAYREGENGEMTPEWVIMPAMTVAQKRHYDSLAVEVERIDKATRPRTPPKRTPPKKIRK